MVMNVLDMPLEVWLIGVYYLIDRIFKTFNGSMAISCTAMLLNNKSGEVYYFNAEYPYFVLYRNKRAEIIPAPDGIDGIDFLSSIYTERQK